MDMMAIMRRLWCMLGWHEWTCAAEQGVPATYDQIADPFWGYWDYAKMYCRHCGAESELSKQQRSAHPRRGVEECP